MAQVTGMVDRLMIKEDNVGIAKNGQEYCPIGINMNGNWYNTKFLWKDKNGGGFILKHDKGGKVEKGDTITITIDDKYNSVDVNKVVLVSKGAGGSAEPTAYKPPFEKKSFTPAKKKAADDVDWDLRNLQIRVGGLLHDSTGLVSSLIQTGSVPKTLLEKAGKDPEKKAFDDSTIMSLVEHYTYQLYMLGDTVVENLRNPSFIENLKLPKEDK